MVIIQMLELCGKTIYKRCYVIFTSCVKRGVYSLNSKIGSIEPIHNPISWNELGFNDSVILYKPTNFDKNQIHNSLVNYFEVRGALLDILKVFDVVWHDGLIFEFHDCGISGKLQIVLQGFLPSGISNDFFLKASIQCGK